ncbi:MAG: (Fe-S)-binding protein, partial [Deltaproteobacteria bacterium]|nr:(Fe-S)-binding protein [Deltaproteobacteria bacterium]
NPWGEPIEKREAWVRQAEVPVYGPGTEHLLFTCCTNDYDARNKQDSRAIVEVLRAAGTSFGHLGNDQRCCGDLAYTAGDTAVFEQLREANRATFDRVRAGSVLVTSPHCLHAFRSRYADPEGRRRGAGSSDGPGERRYRHVVELFAEALEAGALKPARKLARKVTYHDPCYLGRYGGVYDAPREVLAAIPGLEVEEMEHNREASLCCGGGGGGVWIETAKGERVGDLRIREALAVGAEAIVTACPFCVQMLESSILSFGLEERLKVVTVAELLAEALRPGEG